MAAYHKAISPSTNWTLEGIAIVNMQGAAAESLGDDLGRVLERSLKWQHVGPGILGSIIQSHASWQ